MIYTKFKSLHQVQVAGSIGKYRTRRLQIGFQLVSEYCHITDTRDVRLFSSMARWTLRMGLYIVATGARWRGGWNAGLSTETIRVRVVLLLPFRSLFNFVHSTLSQFIDMHKIHEYLTVVDM